MKTFEINCKGRKIGAIGQIHSIRVQVFAKDAEAAKQQLYERWEHISLPQIKEIQSPFNADGIVMAAINNKDTHETIQRHVSGIVSAIGRLTATLAKANANWHDDPGAEDYGLYHAPEDLQYPPEERLVAAAEAVLYFLRETPSGLNVFDRLSLTGGKDQQ